MPDRSTSELARAAARPDVATLREDLRLYRVQLDAGGGWPDDDALTDRFTRIMDASKDDPDYALACLALTMADTDDVNWLAFMAAGPLEDLLGNPSDEMLARIVAEARRTPRFRWLLSGVWPHAIAERCRTPVLAAVGGCTMDDQPLPPRPWV